MTAPRDRFSRAVGDERGTGETDTARTQRRATHSALARRALERFAPLPGHAPVTLDESSRWLTLVRERRTETLRALSAATTLQDALDQLAAAASSDLRPDYLIDLHATERDAWWVA